MGEIICPTNGCNNQDITIYVGDGEFGKGAKWIEFQCSKCGKEHIYKLKEE